MKNECFLSLTLALPLIFAAGNGRAIDTPAPVPSGYTWGHGDYHPGVWQPPANTGANNPSAPGLTPEQLASQQKAAEDAAQRADAQRKQQEEAKAAAQATFDADKQNALNNLKGISSADLRLKSTGSASPSLGLKEIGNADTFPELKLKGLDEPGLKDAVADNSADRKLFEKKNAIQATLDTKAYGQAGVKGLANYLPGAGSNPELGGALERAKAEISKVFDTRATHAGQFDTVMLAVNSETAVLKDQAVRVPDALKNNPRFQKLIIERDALNHQGQVIQQQIQNIKADPAYAQDSRLWTQLDQLQSAQNGVRGMAGYLNNLAGDVVQKKVSIDAVDFSESAPPKKGLDGINVPSP